MNSRLVFYLVMSWFVIGSECVIAQTSVKEGGASMLVYNLYSSNAVMPFKENTRLAFTNTSETENVTLHLFLVANDCKVADQFLSLTANQTVVALASELDPGVRGFLVAVAVDRVTGCPIKFNHLMGEAAIKLATGHRATLLAEGIRALRENPAECVGAMNAAELRFNGERYDVLPRVLAIDSVGSIYDGISTMLVVNRIGGDWRDRAATTGVLFGLLYDDQGEGVSLQWGGNCQVMRPLFPLRPFPRLPPPFEFIGFGHTGWLKFFDVSHAGPLLGAVLVFNANENLSFSSGRNMHHLTYAASSAVTIPLSPPQ
ncbi:MAG: hypothetical protein HOP19_10085 [Acidobacteria bacterium]|nr:hypothetical protein [Acidobacteriota bacterium]